jgi:hypothetical protein
MSWALSPGSLDAMDVSFNTATADDIKAFLKSRNYSEERSRQQEQDLVAVVNAANAAGGNNETLDNVLKLLPNQQTIQGAQAPAEASKRK